jgi:hypothetical protein
MNASLIAALVLGVLAVVYVLWPLLRPPKD